MPDTCLTLLVPPSVADALFDILLDAQGIGSITSAPAAIHTVTHQQWTNSERVLGRGNALQVQLLLDQAALGPLLEQLKTDMKGSGLRYWAQPLILQGEIE
jgi:hypothetical protein